MGELIGEKEHCASTGCHKAARSLQKGSCLRVHPKMGVNSRIPLAGTDPPSVPISCRPIGVPLSSSLSPILWAVGPSALPCAGAAPPQRPALASHRVYSSPAMCLANSGPPKRYRRARPCACPVPPQSTGPRYIQAWRLPASLQEPARNTSHRQHNLPPDCSRPKSEMHPLSAKAGRQR